MRYRDIHTLKQLWPGEWRLRRDGSAVGQREGQRMLEVGYERGIPSVDYLVVTEIRPCCGERVAAQVRGDLSKRTFSELDERMMRVVWRVSEDARLKAMGDVLESRTS